MNAKLRVDPQRIAPALLAWYDAHRRDLPWRAPPGARADPYRVWLSEIMLQQTTVATVAPRFDAFVTRWPDVRALAGADDADVMSAWAGLGYYARARNLLACARTVADTLAARFPDDEGGLRALPGVGAYTAAAIAAIAFGKRAIVIDGNVERVIARLAAIDTPLPRARAEIRAFAERMVPHARAGDFAQAVMDLSARHCRPRNPDCAPCPLRFACSGGATGDAGAYPVKPARAQRPARFGTAYWVEHAGRVLLVRRPGKGLLGGMRALPTGPWVESPPGLAGTPLAHAQWRWAAGRARHVFTHFRLELALAVTRLDAPSGVPGGEWWPIDTLDSAGLPTVFVKAARLRRE